MSFLKAFGGFSIQNVARVMGLGFWFCWGTYLPKIWVSRPSSAQSQTVTDLSPTHTSSRTAEFMSN